MDWSGGWQFAVYAPPLLFAAVVLFGLSLYLAARQDVRERLPEASVAALLLAAAGVWLGTYGLELLRTDLASKLLLNRLAYLGSATLPALWYEYIRLHVGDDESLSRRRRAALWSVPAVMLALVFTNGWHALVWERVYLDESAGFVSLVNDHGPAFYAFTVYIYGLVFAGMNRLVAVARRTTGTRQKQVVTLLAGAAFPALGGAIYVAPWNPVPTLNLPAVAFAATAAAVAWSVVRHGLFTLVPVGWRTVVEQLDEAAVVLDDDGRVLAHNPAAEAYLSVDPGAAYGADGRDALHPVVAGAVWAPPDGEARGDGGSGPGDGDRRNGDGDADVSTPADGAAVTTRTLERPGTESGDRYVEVQRSPLRDGRRRVGSVVVIRDVTDRRRREMRLRAQNERLDRFASVVSHDLRNPLNVARGYAELARESGDEEHFDRIDRAHERIERIVTDLLVLAREGDAVGEAEPVSLTTAAETAWESVDTGGETRSDRRATLTVAGETTLEADPPRLRHLFENLFRNAVEHGSETGRPEAAPVAVEVGPLGDGGFYVEDDGTGIPTEERERVFERGFTTDDEGTGLGLSIVEEIATAHGWTPRVTEAASGGARFEFAPARD